MSSSALEALSEKEKGNDAYRRRKFDVALQHYDKAIELDSTNITFLCNKAAVYFEQKNYDLCRKMCSDAVELGRKNQADFRMIAKALARIGNSHVKENNFAEAAVYFKESLAEHHSTDVLNKLRNCKKSLAEQERLAYIDPEIAKKEKDEANELFQKGAYHEALKRYDEAIKRDPENASLYSIRAACYVRLGNLLSALADCEQCINKDSTFIQGHIRKAAVLEATKDFSRAIDAYEKALDIDPTNKEAEFGLERCLVKDYEIRNSPESVEKRTFSHPEVHRILSDPEMASVLSQIKKDPKTLLQHTKDPRVATNMRKLVELGVVSVR